MSKERAATVVSKQSDGMSTLYQADGSINEPSLSSLSHQMAFQSILACIL